MKCNNPHPCGCPALLSDGSCQAGIQCYKGLSVGYQPEGNPYQEYEIPEGGSGETDEVLKNYYVAYAYSSIYGTSTGSFYPLVHPEVNNSNIEDFKMKVRDKAMRENTDCNGMIVVLSWQEVPEV